MPRVSKANDARQNNAQRARIQLQKHIGRIRQERRDPSQRAALENLIQYFKNGIKPFCPHLVIGSSRFFDLITQKLTARNVHARNSDRQDYEIGSRWERHVADLGFIPSERFDFVKFEVLDKDPLYRSNTCRLVIGQPDFRAKITNSQGKSEQVLIEVKSTNRAQNYQAFKTGRAHSQRYQVQICLQCSGIDKGYLIFARGTAQTPELSEHIEYRVLEIFREPNFFPRHKLQIVKGDARFLADLASFPNRPTASLIEYSEAQVQKYQSSLFSNLKSDGQEEQNTVIGITGDFRTQCRINRLIIKDKMELQGLTRKVGRPRKKGSELVRPRYGRKSELAYQIRFPSDN